MAKGYFGVEKNIPREWSELSYAGVSRVPAPEEQDEYEKDSC